jgi:MiaB-like tRNA modifying enzyme
MQNYIYLQTYGCSANINNSEILSGLLKQAGYEITNNPDIAEIIIINTCIVKQKTENKIKRRIQDLAKTYKDKLMIIAGCMPETDKKSLEKLFPNALLLGTHHMKEIIKLIKDYKDNKLTRKKQENYLSYIDEEKLLFPKIPKNKLISITQISEGCLGDCHFCKAKLAKGKLFSYDLNHILASIESDLQQGAKEIWITSQDNAAYNLDKGKQLLPELLKKILNLKHNFKLRLGMMNPNNLHHIQDEILDLYSHPKMYKFLHIPIQSVSDRVLSDMNRKYNINLVKKIINKFKKEFPDITIATDIITGYPTETPKSHQENLDFLNTFKPDVFNLSKFSKHKNTKAESLQELPINIVNKRASELMDAHKKTALQNKQKFIGKTTKVFVNNKHEGFFLARDDNYNIVLLNNKENVIGKHVNVKIKQAGVHHLFGERI